MGDEEAYSYSYTDKRKSIDRSHNNWNTKIEEYCKEKAKECEDGYVRSISESKKYKKYDNLLGYTPIIISSIATIYAFFIRMFMSDAQAIEITIMGLVTFLTGVLNTVQKKMKPWKKAAQYARIAGRYHQMNSLIVLQLKLYRHDRVNGTKFIKDITQTINTLNNKESILFVTDSSDNLGNSDGISRESPREKNRNEERENNHRNDEEGEDDHRKRVPDTVIDMEEMSMDDSDDIEDIIKEKLEEEDLDIKRAKEAAHRYQFDRFMNFED